MTNKRSLFLGKRNLVLAVLATVCGLLVSAVAEFSDNIVMQGLQDTLAVQANWDPKAAKAKAEDFVDLRFVNNLKTRGFFDKLYGGAHN